MNKNKNIYVTSKGKEYFNTAGLIEEYPDNQFYIIVGQRSNGKTFSTLKYLIDDYFENGRQFFYLRRLQENIKGNLMDTVFNDFQRYVADKYEKRIRFFRQAWYLIPVDEDAEFKISECPIIGYAQSITNTEKMKSTSYPDVYTIVFEEFIATMAYIPDEVNLLQQIISTVFRSKPNCKVILLGNTISKSNPYTEALGISLKDFPKGQTVIKHNIASSVSTSVCIHRCDVKTDAKEQQKITVGFTAFGDTDFGTMIHEGNFETIQGKRHINGITLPGLQKHIPNGIKPIVNMKATYFFVNYLDIFYRIYIHQNGRNNVLGFEPVEKPTNNCRILISGNTNYMSKDYRLITSINFHGLDKETANFKTLDKIVGALKSGFFVTRNDEHNDDIIKAFASVGLDLGLEKAKM